MLNLSWVGIEITLLANPTEKCPESFTCRKSVIRYVEIVCKLVEEPKAQTYGDIELPLEFYQ